MLQFILFRAAERSGRPEETRAHAPRGRLPAGPPHPAFPKGEIPMCFPLGPKADLPEAGNFPPLVHTPVLFLLFFQCPRLGKSLWEFAGYASVFLQPFATFENMGNLALAF